MSPTWRRIDRDAIVLSLHVQPGAKRMEVVGTHGDALKLRLAAAPVEGKANAALLRWLAEAFDVPTRNVVLLHGETSRAKVVKVIAPRRYPPWFE